MVAALVVLVCALLVFLLAFRMQENTTEQKNDPSARKASSAPTGRKDAGKRPAPAVVRPVPSPARTTKDDGRQKEQKHLDLLPQVEALYRSASKDKDPFSPQMESCIALCKKDIALAQGCKAYWEGAHPANALPAYPSFARLALIHEKRNEFDKAVKICQRAIQLGFTEDGTKGGMEGRLARLQKKKASAG